MIFTYCPNCGQKNSIQNKTLTEYICHNCRQIFWDNPKATVAVVLLNKDRQALYSQRAIEPNKGKYDFPGGFLEYNEDVYHAAVRELKEELDITIKPNDLRIITAYTLEYLPGVSVTDIVMVADSWQGQLRPQDDVAAAVWRPLSFMRSSQFAPSYKNLETIINHYLDQ